MRDIFFDLSVRSVRLNFMRSLLASIGIVIGVVAISSMGMLGANMQLSVKQQLILGCQHGYDLIGCGTDQHRPPEPPPRHRV